MVSCSLSAELVVRDLGYLSTTDYRWRSRHPCHMVSCSLSAGGLGFRVPDWHGPCTSSVKSIYLMFNILPIVTHLVEAYMAIFMRYGSRTLS